MHMWVAIPFRMEVTKEGRDQTEPVMLVLVGGWEVTVFSAVCVCVCVCVCGSAHKYRTHKLFKANPVP